MGQPAFSLNVTFRTETCYKCGVPFAAPSYFFVKREEDHATWFCPNGHGQVFSGESEAEKNARLLREEQERHKRTLARENETIAEKQKLERKLKRVQRGTCPECNRSFTNLARHMACKHAATPD